MENVSVEISSGTGQGRGNKLKWWRGEFNYDIFILRTFVNAIMYLHTAQ
jgi:hypothetical protein